MVKINRNSGVELFRTVLMFGIVMLHVIGQGGYCWRGYWDAFRPCVVGFVFISGFYGIRLSWLKVLKLIAIAIWCAIISVGLRILILGDPVSTWLSGVLHSLANGYWFLWAYVLLMFFAPIVNIAVESSAEGRKALSGILFVVFGWSFLAIAPGLGQYIPSPIGFGELAPLTLLGVYIAGRIFHFGDLQDKIGTRWLVLGLLGCFAGIVCGLGHYNSPVALVFMGLLFCVFYRIHLPQVCGKLLGFLTPSLFSVSLLHQARGGWNPIYSWMQVSVGRGLPVPVAWAEVALGVFLGGLLIDFLFRRVILIALNKGVK